MSDPRKYRTREEEEGAKERDSIANLASHLMTSKDDGGRECLSEDEWKDMQKRIKDVVRESLEFAEESEEPGVEEELYSDVFLNPPDQMSPIGKYHDGAPNPLLDQARSSDD